MTHAVTLDYSLFSQGRIGYNTAGPLQGRADEGRPDNGQAPRPGRSPAHQIADRQQLLQLESTDEESGMHTAFFLIHLLRVLSDRRNKKREIIEFSAAVEFPPREGVVLVAVGGPGGVELGRGRRRRGRQQQAAQQHQRRARDGHEQSAGAAAAGPAVHDH